MGRFERGLAKRRVVLVEGHTSSMTCATDCSCMPEADRYRPNLDEERSWLDEQPPLTIEGYISRKLRTSFRRAMIRDGVPLPEWCPLCGDHHLPDPDCPIDLDELAAMDGLR